MPVSLPPNPAVGDTVIAGGKTYYWNGESWFRYGDVASYASRIFASPLALRPAVGQPNDLWVVDDPTDAANHQTGYVWSATDNAWILLAGASKSMLTARYVNLTGDTMTGTLLLDHDPIDFYEAATRQYVQQMQSSSVPNLVAGFQSRQNLGTHWAYLYPSVGEGKLEVYGNPITATIHLVGGGGSGGSNAGGGGGAGGVRTWTNVTLHGSYGIYVGAGGAGPSTTTNGSFDGTNGENSRFGQFIANGGGGGGAGRVFPTTGNRGLSGGSCGGSGPAAIGRLSTILAEGVEGHLGGESGNYSGGGGGGAGGRGANPIGDGTGRGGNGRDLTGGGGFFHRAGGGGEGGKDLDRGMAGDFAGVHQLYGGGQASGYFTGTNIVGSGLPQTGGGGGGGSRKNGSPNGYPAGRGGSGYVIVIAPK